MESLLEFNIASGLAIKIENQNEMTNKNKGRQVNRSRQDPIPGGSIGVSTLTFPSRF